YRLAAGPILRPVFAAARHAPRCRPSPAHPPRNVPLHCRAPPTALRLASDALPAPIQPDRTAAAAPPTNRAPADGVPPARARTRWFPALPEVRAERALPWR